MMGNSKLLFIDHAFHKKTLSSDFFIQVLSRDFAISTIHLNPHESLNEEIIDKASNVDYILLWQMDYLAPIFLALGKPVIVVPMYDGSATLPALHWLAQSRALFINFSVTLHMRLQALGLESKLLKYFLPPVSSENRASFDEKLKVFIWHRRPEHGINVALVERLLGDQIGKLHVHDAPDDKNIDGQRYVRRTGTYELSVTSWFENFDDYLDVLSESNTFICPRRTEGIGIAMLEALSRGMLVLAPDEPTHTEYIANWTNGILFHPDAPQPANVLDVAGELGLRAWTGACLGYDAWIKQAATISNFIRTADRPAPLPIEKSTIVEFGQELSRAFYNGHGDYDSFLQRHLRMLSAVSGLSSAEILDKRSGY